MPPARAATTRTAEASRVLLPLHEHPLPLVAADNSSWNWDTQLPGDKLGSDCDFDVCDLISAPLSL
jgi:hypothetical protein